MNSFDSFFVPNWFSSIYWFSIWIHSVFQQDEEKKDYSKQLIELKSVQFAKLLHYRHW